MPTRTKAASAFTHNPETPAFEAANVKINRQEPFVDRAMRVKGDTLTMRNLNLRMIAAKSVSAPRD